MANKILIIFLVIIGILIIGAGAYYFFMQNPSNSSTNQNNIPSGNQSGAQTSNPNNIEIGGFAFNPSTLTIKTGETVTWSNMDPVSHTITSDSGSELNSAPIPNGQTYSHTFNTVGTYSYHCSIHTSMKGQIIVE